MNPVVNDPNPDFEENDIEKFISMINSGHSSVQLEGIIGIRKWLPRSFVRM